MPDGTTTIPEGIAANVRRHRVRRGWTLDLLAGRSGVSRGMLIQIEQARTNPSVGTLVRIAEAFGMTLAQLVDVTVEEPVRLVPAADAVTVWTLPGSASRAVLQVGTETAPRVELWQWTLEPGDAHGSDAHPAGTTEMLNVLDGELTLDVDGASYVLSAGDSVTFRADCRHRYANRSEDRLRFVMVVSMPKATA